jgi:hypothetical protein
MRCLLQLGAPERKFPDHDNLDVEKPMRVWAIQRPDRYGKIE